MKTKKTDELLHESEVDNAVVRRELMQELLQSEPFEYDLNRDAMFRYYSDMYTHAGREAAGDVFGKAASLTGGYANSYAQAIAGETYNNYMQDLQEKGMELYENAYTRYKDNRAQKMNMLKIADSLEREEYDRRIQAENTQYERERDTEQTEYEREQAARKEQYEREQDAKKDEENRSKTQYEQEQDVLAFAFKMAQLGDYSYLKNAGVDISVLEAAEKQAAEAPEKINVSIQNEAEETYNSYGYYQLVAYLDRQIAYGQITEKGKQQILQVLTGRT